MSSENIAIRVRNLDRKYTIGGLQEHYQMLRDAIVNFSESAIQAIPSSSS